MTCECSLAAGSTYAHCRECCDTFLTVALFDLHRVNGECYDLTGVTVVDGLIGTPEGHAKRLTLSRRFSKS